MRIFLLDYDTKYANAVVSDENDALKLSFDGTSCINSWEEVKIKSPFKSRKIADFMYYTQGTIIASQKAVKELYPLIGPYVEALPLQCDWGEYYALNVLALLDCIDYSASEYIPFDDKKTAAGVPKVLKITKHVFYEDRIRNIPIFKNVHRPRMPIYVNDDFVDLVVKLKLKGLEFKPVWEDSRR